MASSMTTEANGVRVVTHVIPLEEKMESPELKASSVKVEKSNLPPRRRMFLKGKPLSLGLVQLFVGLVILSLCTIALLVDMLQANYVICLGLPFVLSGSITIAAHKRSGPALVKGTLAMNVMCALLAAAGAGYFSWELSIRPGQGLCNSDTDWSCRDMFRRFNSLTDGVKGLLLTLSVLQMCVCISLSIFSCRAINQDDETDVDLYGSDTSLLKDGVDCASNP